MMEIENETAAVADETESHASDSVRDGEVVEKCQQSEQPSLVVIKAEYIPESGEVRCMICYTPVTDTEEFQPDDEENRPEIQLPHPKLPTIYRSLGVKVSSRMKSFYEEFKPPLCSLCLETSHKAKEVVDQLDELEKALNTVGEQIKEKLVTSFEERERERDVYDEPMEGLCNRMITVNRIREDVMKDISKRLASKEVKKPGRPKSRTKAGQSSEYDNELQDSTSIGKEISGSKKPEKKLHPSSSSRGDQNVDEKFHTQTSSGRLIKRPKFFVSTNNYTESDSESELDEKPLEVILEEGMETPTTAGINDMEDNPDPEWSPGHVVSEHEMECSSSEDSDLESAVEENEDMSDGDLKSELLDIILPEVQHRKKKKKRKAPTSTPRKIATKVGVKVVADDGEEFDGVYNCNKNVEDVKELDLMESVKIEAGVSISVHDKIIGQIRIKCSETGCVRTFSDIPRMKLHVLRKHKGIENPYSCTSCDKAFARPSLLKLHRKEHGVKVSEVNAGVKKYRACEFEGCEQKYRNKSELQIHIRKVHTLETPFKCDYCAEGFISALKREFHVETSHPEIPPLKCEHCPRGYFRKHRLREHIKSHTKERSYLCEICSKSFSQPAYLRYHQTQHKELELEPYKCDQCDRTFATPVNLRIHQQTQHMKEYRFHCEICNHGATHMSHLRLHMRTHSGDRPYRCDQCDKSFTRGSQLKIHIRSHTGERPYQCELCDKNFTNSSKLRRHELTHSVEKPHKCPTCGRGFSQLTNLNSHVKSAHNKERATKKTSMAESSVQAPVFQPHQIFGIPQQNLPDLPLQFQVVNEGNEGTVPSYAEFIILNQTLS